MKDKLLFLDRTGFPVEGIVGRPVVSFIRKLLWARKIVKYNKWIKERRLENELESDVKGEPK